MLSRICGMKPIRVYGVDGVKRIAAFIPRGHLHIRLLIELEDQVVVLQEAVAAAITRAFLNVLLHPSRRASELVLTEVDARKPGYARFQLIESSRRDEDLVDEYTRMLEFNLRSSRE